MLGEMNGIRISIWDNKVITWFGFTFCFQTKRCCFCLSNHFTPEWVLNVSENCFFLWTFKFHQHPVRVGVPWRKFRLWKIIHAVNSVKRFSGFGIKMIWRNNKTALKRCGGSFLNFMCRWRQSNNSNEKFPIFDIFFKCLISI